MSGLPRGGGVALVICRMIFPLIRFRTDFLFLLDTIFFLNAIIQEI